MDAVVATATAVRTGCVLRWLAGASIALTCVIVLAQEPRDDRDPQPHLMLDVREPDVPVTAEKGNFVAVPIPFSNPTLDTGLIGAAAYFYPQTEEEASAQPASVTGFGVMVTRNDSRGAAIGHNGYWKQDRWRFSGTLGYVDLTLPLVSSDDTFQILGVDWNIKGWLLSSELSRRVGQHWFVGITGNYIDIEQKFSVNLLSLEFALPDAFEVAGLGATLTFDTRDTPINAYDGRYFRVTASTDTFADSDLSYESYSLAFRSYHTLNPSLVLAWELKSCAKSDGVPLWDACGIDLRGFAATDYLGKSSWLAQVESRWKLSKRWGLVAFAGAGQISRSLSGLRDGETIPSYGAGLRFMVSTEKRINMRLDYGRSTDSDAVYLSVGEDF